MSAAAICGQLTQEGSSLEGAGVAPVQIRWSGSPENQVWRLAGDVGAQTVSDAAGATEFSR